MRKIVKARKLDSVCYDIRGAVLHEARRLEEEGHRILKLNIGNPAHFGFDTPDEIIQDIIHNLSAATGYTDAKGIFGARKAVMQYTQQQGIAGIDIENIFIGNGVSELIVMATQGLLNEGDEVLIPAPDYPLWTAAVTLSGGRPVHYRCDEQADWHPDLADLRAQITDRTRALVVINPNNPTGAVYARELLEALVAIAHEHDLVIFADEIYDKVLYDEAIHVPLASLTEDVLVLTFGGLSKNYRAAGFRTGWMIVGGARQRACDYLEGLEILASMRLCANVPAQFGVQTALGGYQSINDLVAPNGRLSRQRDLAYALVNQIPGASCVKPRGALYLFPRLDPAVYPIHDDEQFVLDLLLSEQILLVQGTAFNWPEPDHFRIVFLPKPEDLTHAMTRLGHFLEHYRQ